MTSKKIAVFLLFLSCIVFPSCNQNTASNSKTEKTVKAESTVEIEKEQRAQHPYGGWYCPDNVLGFPAVNIQELDKVPVVSGRLPTQEETRNGTSLMYFDPTKVQNAKPLNIALPKLARYYSEYTEKNELVIIIQAVVVGNDTIAGFRYLNGGNGTDWFREVNFVSDEEINKLEATSFISQNVKLNTTKGRIWAAITSPNYAKSLSTIFEKGNSIESDWKQDAKNDFKYQPNKIVNNGVITAIWKDTYIQIDYDLDGYHHVEKILLLDNEENDSIDLHIVSGPYGEDFEAQKTVWNNWLQKVKKLSEG